MAGAFTHFIICDVAKRKRSVLGFERWRFLNKYSEFLFLGSASPDLPYLSFKTGDVNWADVMHYEKTNGIVIGGYDFLKAAWPNRTVADEIKFAWLMGYASHLVADATIHPIVQAIVGPYYENKENHRICEMTQDSLIFNEYKKNDIYYAEFSSILKFCNESEAFNELIDFWKNQIIQNYQDKTEEPNPKLWFMTYTEAIDTAEGGSGAAALFRHIGFSKEYFYRSREEIISNYPNYYQNYFKTVNLPGGATGSFKKEGFERTISNVLSVWNFLFSGLNENIVVADVIKNWNLDTGVDLDASNSEVTYWV